MRQRYRDAPTFAEYLDGVVKNRELWHGINERVRLPDELLREARALPDPWNLLALSEDWCGDAVNLLPIVSHLVDQVPSWDLRVLERDTNLDIMDAHLTDGRSRSIPIVILLDQDFVERGWWGPRPEPIQTWVMDEGLAIESKERYRTIRQWYARDRGVSTVREIIDLMKDVCVAC